MIQKIKTYSKPLIAFITILAYRQLPVRPPNVEPILATIMPLSKKFGILSSIVFSVLSIVFHDILTAGIGAYTWTAALTYALVALGSGLYFASRKATTRNFIVTSSVGIVFYDVMTGIVLGPLATGGSIYMAFIGQIPFTALHLMGGVLFAMVLSPVLSQWFEASEVKVLEKETVAALG